MAVFDIHFHIENYTTFSTSRNSPQKEICSFLWKIIVILLSSSSSASSKEKFQVTLRVDVDGKVLKPYDLTDNEQYLKVSPFADSSHHRI
jgi:hypothetical protein